MNAVNQSRWRDAGLLVLRIGIGCAFMAHGYPKLFGGPHEWTVVGNMAKMPAPEFFGFSAGLVEFVGGILLILGLLVRFAAFFLLVQMLVAIFRVHLPSSMPMLHQFASGWSHPLEDGIVFLSLLLIGAGQFSLDALLWRRRASGSTP